MSPAATAPAKGFGHDVPRDRDVTARRPAARGHRGPGSASRCRPSAGRPARSRSCSATLVDEKRWIGQQRFLHALNYCMLLPGPEAQQLAIYTGWLLNGVARRPDRRRPVRAARRARAARAVRRSTSRYGDTDRRRPALFARPGAGGARDRRPGRRPDRPAARSATPRSSALAVAAFLALAVFARAVPARRARRPGVVGWLLGRWRRGAGGADAERGRRRPGAADPRRRAAPSAPPRAGAPGDPGRRAGRCGSRRSPLASALHRSATASSPTRACSSPARRWSPSAAPTRCWPTSRSRRSRRLRLADAGRDGARARAGRDHARPLIMVVQFVAFLGAYRDPGALRPVGRRGPRRRC